ncbi:hypothetical protein TNCV_2890591 [Trichonephila clavipes]|nr:hypothetical protein TNCV_2890591 [Trichonephila clavipes]
MNIISKYFGKLGRGLDFDSLHAGDVIKKTSTDSQPLDNEFLISIEKERVCEKEKEIEEKKCTNKKKFTSNNFEEILNVIGRSCEENNPNEKRNFE